MKNTIADLDHFQSDPPLSVAHEKLSLELPRLLSCASYLPGAKAGALHNEKIR